MDAAHIHTTLNRNTYVHSPQLLIYEYIIHTPHTDTENHMKAPSPCNAHTHTPKHVYAKTRSHLCEWQQRGLHKQSHRRDVRCSDREQQRGWSEDAHSV